MAEQIESIKWISGTRFMVDGFRFQHPACQNYFLTHFHSDHTTGLTRSFAAGLVYCSPVTAALLRKDMGLPAARICPLKLDMPVVIDGVEVVLIDANHCPGACMFLFKVPARAGPPPTSAMTILHTGDFRWHARMGRHPALCEASIDILILDTTYCLPKYTLPTQEEALAAMVKVVREHVAKVPGALLVVGSYHIGKERAYLGLAAAFKWKVWVSPAKMRVLSLLGLPSNQTRWLTRRKGEARIHVLPMSQLLPDPLEAARRSGSHSSLVAIRPTGWTFRKNGGLEVRREGLVTIFGVPYSEHSSYTELRACVAALRPRRIVPTVNSSQPRRAAPNR
eukprot:jgi/Botrbrau1/13979/Bobra.117_2s0009.1